MEKPGKTLSERQAEAAAMLGDKLNHPRLGATLALVEEMGELVKEVMELEIYQQAQARPKMEDEVADILFSLLEVCNAYGISLETAYDRKLEKIRHKLPDWEEKYSAGLKQMKAKLD
ncbi:MAG: nucleotide pyrophosphohydrolase [Chloroflexi bacterium]|jgi:NTP pyrophosphatase (non-canonical NTP hydrolase)|nr:nucleotide pyrophosphohydrolase [Chloroflexota bacterium]